MRFDNALGVIDLHNFELIFFGLATAVAGIFNLRTKHNEFVNDYYKLVIHKRVESYEIVESVFRGYETTLLDGDNRPYYIVFDEDDNWQNFYAPLTAALSNAIWLSDDLLEIAKYLNSLLFHVPSMTSEITEFGKQNYFAISKIRDALEKQLAADMLELHQVKKFLLQKKRNRHGFHEVNLANVVLGKKNPNKIEV